MKLIYLDLGMGAAGDMLTGALLALLPETERAALLERLNALLPAEVEAALEPAEQCGVTGLHYAVRVRGAEERHGGAHHHHAHAHLADIEALLAAMALTEEERAEVTAVYAAVAEAESAVHGVPVTEVHFHELGALDAVADITGCVLALRALGAARVCASPLAVGRGTVRCAHGVLPVPAPATALLLKGVPVCAGDAEGELCTPTGAALVKRFVTEFGPLPAMTPEAVGCGFGTKDFGIGRPNCVRAMVGEAYDLTARGETVFELSCNLDDMTAEDIGFALERVRAAGALEAFTVPAQMKKDRPGALFTALCRAEKREAVRSAMFAHTATLGVRERELTRYSLERTEETVETALGPVRRKRASGFGTEKCKWEYDDLAAIAREKGLPLAAVRKALDDGRAD